MFELWMGALPLALALDLLVGDPPWLPHPVRALGHFIAKCEKLLRYLGCKGLVGGIALVLCTLALAGGTVAILLAAAYALHPWIHQALQVWLVYQGLALGDLRREVLAIGNVLHQGDLPLARERTARIVSRSTVGMDSSALARSAIESAAENGVDGVLAPMFWAALGGPMGLWLFKAVSTLDSMVGYRTETYEWFGKAAARLDDLLNWIPARLSLILFSLADPPRVLQGLRTGWRDHNLHASPNSGWSEATMAGLLGKRLGGPAVYHGTLVAKPWFGAQYPDAQSTDVYKALSIVTRACVLGLVLLVACHALPKFLPFICSW